MAFPSSHAILNQGGSQSGSALISSRGREKASSIQPIVKTLAPGQRPLEA